jgi:hypothetical protein
MSSKFLVLSVLVRHTVYELVANTTGIATGAPDGTLPGLSHAL